MDVLYRNQIFVMIHMVTKIQQVLYTLFQVVVDFDLSSLHGFPYVDRLFLCMLFDLRFFFFLNYVFFIYISFVYLRNKKLSSSLVQYLVFSSSLALYHTNVLSTFESGGIGRNPNPVNREEKQKLSKLSSNLRIPQLQS